MCSYRSPERVCSQTRPFCFSSLNLLRMPFSNRLQVQSCSPRTMQLRNRTLFIFLWDEARDILLLSSEKPDARFLIKPLVYQLDISYQLAASITGKFINLKINIYIISKIIWVKLDLFVDLESPTGKRIILFPFLLFIPRCCSLFTTGSKVKVVYPVCVQGSINIGRLKELNIYKTGHKYNRVRAPLHH